MMVFSSATPSGELGSHSATPAHRHWRRFRRRCQAAGGAPTGAVGTSGLVLSVYIVTQIPDAAAERRTAPTPHNQGEAVRHACIVMCAANPAGCSAPTPLSLVRGIRHARVHMQAIDLRRHCSWITSPRALTQLAAPSGTLLTRRAAVASAAASKTLRAPSLRARTQLPSCAQADGGGSVAWSPHLMPHEHDHNSWCCTPTGGRTRYCGWSNVLHI